MTSHQKDLITPNAWQGAVTKAQLRALSKITPNGHVHVQLGRPDHNHHQVGQNISQIKENVQHRTGVATPHTLRENEEHVGVDAVAKQ